MTHIDRLQLQALLDKGSDADLLREMMTFLVNRMMDVDVENITGAAYGERSDSRANSRNGYRDRPWHTGIGTIPVAIPKLRKGSYFPQFLEPRRTADKALVAVIQEAYVHGVSTRSVDDLVKAMGMSGISKSQVSRLCEDIDERVKTFLQRPIEGTWPYLWIDATYVKVREAGRIVSVAVIIAVAANTDGRREVVGMKIGPSEAEPFWTDFLRSLTRRGLRGVKLVVSDSHEGLKKAVGKVLHATWQRCAVHFMRNAMASVTVKQRGMVAAAIRTAFAQETEKEAHDEWRAVADRLRERFAKVSALMDAAEHDVLAYMSFHKSHWSQIRSTNPLERLNREVKRRTNVVSIFPNEAAIERLVGALLLECNDEWAVSRRYMSLETMAGLSHDASVKPPAIPAA
jgi:transposase-like protein